MLFLIRQMRNARQPLPNAATRTTHGWSSRVRKLPVDRFKTMQIQLGHTRCLSLVWSPSL